MNTRFKLAAAITLASSLSAFADVKINDNFSTAGYVSASASNTVNDGTQSSFMDVDSVKISSIASFDKVTGVASVHTFNSSDLVVLDAYATYKASDSFSLTLGKYLSYLGYEAFDYPNMLQISYANTFGAFIPAYHTGVKADFTAGAFSAGISVTDSIYGSTYYKGDSTLDNGAGLEVYGKLTSGNTSLFAAIAMDDGVSGSKDGRTTFDIWAQTKAGNVTLAAEYVYSNLKAATGEADGFFWLALAQAPVGGKWTVTGRVSGGEDEALTPIGGSTPKFLKGTISPAVTITDNLGLLFEYSHINYDNHSVDKTNYYAAQVIFKW